MQSTAAFLKKKPHFSNLLIMNYFALSPAARGIKILPGTGYLCSRICSELTADWPELLNADFLTPSVGSQSQSRSIRQKGQY